MYALGPPVVGSHAVRCSCLTELSAEDGDVAVLRTLSRFLVTLGYLESEHCQNRSILPAARIELMDVCD
jgi:hypothetical protein